MLDAETERAWLESQTGGKPNVAPTTKEFPDGSLRQYNPQTGAWEVLAPGNTTTGYVTRPMPNEELQATVDTRLPVSGERMVGNTLYGRVGDSATYEPLQQFGAEAAGPKYREFGGNLYRETPNGLVLEMEKPPSAGAAAPQRAPRWPEEVELARLQVEQAKRSLEDPYTQALRQTNTMIDTIQEQLASGQLSLDEGERLMALARANLQAALQGTTPYQLDEQRRTAERQKQVMAQSYLNNQMQAGTSMAGNLLSGAMTAYGRVLKSSNPPPMFNPLEMARQYVYQLGGGDDEMTQLARAILQGALQGGA